MAEITPILQNFQDFLTGKVPFDQIPKIQEDDQYYEDQLECKNICGRPQGAKNKNKNKNKTKDNTQYLKSLKEPKRRGRPPSKVTSSTTPKSQSITPSPIMEVDSSEDSEASLSK
ncbi:hypothetical protein O181_100430 [Austropuccinia psidii MF-1]|uniref:Uncharacterized protein n=1 Tax=Austropuccinia psidii MF-1 TaxID=1389203 RepID=A0A9Q3JCQ3_9BASI|nr:hypothetical protein [Austropuccinia psidii MF-1]